MNEKINPVILVVEDDEGMLFYCQHELKQHYTVHAVKSAEEMFTALESLTPDLILLDIILPGMDGYQAARTLKSDERYKGIPIIFISGLTDEMSETEGFNAGAVDYIYKPIVASQLIRRIGTQLHLLKLQNEMKELQLSIKSKNNEMEDENNG